MVDPSLSRVHLFQDDFVPMSALCDDLNGILAPALHFCTEPVLIRASSAARA